MVKHTQTTRRQQPTNCLSVFDHLLLKGLNFTGSLQLCAGQDAGTEITIHVVCEMFCQEDAEAVTMVDASNAFNSIDCGAFLHNLKILCPSLSTYINNCYSSLTDLYVQGDRSIKSEKGKAQGDLSTMTYMLSE